MQKVQISVPIPASTQGSPTETLTATTQIAGARLSNDGAGIFVVPVADAGGFLLTPLMLDDNNDNVASIETPRYLGVVNRNTLYDNALNTWYRARTLIAVDEIPAGEVGYAATTSFGMAWSPSENFFNRMRLRPSDGEGDLGNDAEGTALDTMARQAVFQGVQGWRYARAANIDTMLSIGSLSGVPLMTPAGEWSQTDAPAAATAASTSKAGDGIVMHVCKSVSITLTCVAAQPPILFVLRDDATGAGNILRQWRLSGLAGTSVSIDLADLNIMGVPGNAMTLESTTAPAGTNFAVVNFSGISISD